MSDGLGIDVVGAPPHSDDSSGISPSEPEPQPDVSPLGSLRRKVQKARAERFFERPVPGLKEIVVRYGPISAEDTARIYRARKKEPIERQSLLMAADVLATACLGIYERGPDGELIADGQYLSSPDGRPVTFATLNLDSAASGAYDQVLALYATDGDVIGTSAEVIRFSGYSNDELQGVVLGE